MLGHASCNLNLNGVGICDMITQCLPYRKQQVLQDILKNRLDDSERKEKRST